MQDKTHKSQLIRLNNLANKKARRRLIGSIFLLIIALLILFHVSSKIKPIPIKPESIEIKTHNKPISSDALGTNPIVVESRAAVMDTLKAESHNITSNTIVAQQESAITTPQKNLSKIVSSETSHRPASAKISNAADLLNENKSDMDDNTEKEVASKETVVAPAPIHLNPTIAIEQETVHKSSPEDILNGIMPEKTHPKYYVQLMASTDKTKMMAAKTKLAHNGIYASIQSAKHGANTIYRLRIGPFSDKIKAKARLTEVQSKLNE